MYKIAIAAALILCACSPLKKIEQSTHTDSVTTRDDLTNLIRKEMEQCLGTFRQTVVEFYPSAESPQPLNRPDTLRGILSPPKIPTRQSIKRITYTEATSQVDKTTSTDSISRSRINTAARRDTQVQTEEKPSSGVSWLRWATALAGALLLILLFIKLG